MGKIRNVINNHIGFFRKVKRVTVFLIALGVTILTWIGLTLAEYIPDYFDIKSCPEVAPTPENYRDSQGHGWEMPYTTDDKPVIYLYPQSPENIKVSLDFDGKLTATYPAYNNGWNVFAYPDGKIINSSDNKEYSYLFWEGISSEGTKYDFNEGFVVEGKDTAIFLQDKLSQLGLTPKEYNEFIVYWMPKMQNNKYNLIHFASKEEYDDHARLTIDPKPDSVLRIFMVYKSLEERQEVESQEIKPFERKGFSVVEWGGSEVEQD